MNGMLSVMLVVQQVHQRSRPSAFKGKPLNQLINGNDWQPKRAMWLNTCVDLL